MVNYLACFGITHPHQQELSFTTMLTFLYIGDFTWFYKRQLVSLLILLEQFSPWTWWTCFLSTSATTSLVCIVLETQAKINFFLTRSLLPSPLYTYSMLQACLLLILLHKSYALMKLQAFFNTLRIVAISRWNWYNSLILTLHPCLKQYHKKKDKYERQNFQKLVSGKKTVGNFQLLDAASTFWDFILYLSLVLPLASC